jgi:hypothetical protein
MIIVVVPASAEGCMYGLVVKIRHAMHYGRKYWGDKKQGGEQHL